MRNLFLLFFICFSTSLSAQTTAGMVAYYTMDSSLIDVTGNTANIGVVVGATDYKCGVLASSLLLDGSNTEISFKGPVNN